MRLPTYQMLSKEQDQLMNLPLDGSYLIKGPPGTGKTVVALYRANTLESQGKIPLLLMYSRLLMMYTDAATDELDIEGRVETFNRWFWFYYKENYGTPPPQLEKWVFDWMKILTQVNLDPPDPRGMKYVLIDEAQDLPKEFFSVAQMLSKNLTVFADEHQQITETKSTFQDILAYSGIPSSNVRELRKNYRNSRQIAEVARKFYVGQPSGQPDIPDRAGTKPRVLKHASVRDTIDYVARYARTWETKEIGILAPTAKLRNRFYRELNERIPGKVQIYKGGQGAKAPTVTFGTPGIVVLHHQAAKGLEFDTVFLPELQEMNTDTAAPHLTMLLYVLVSRAREDLFLSYSGGVRAPVLRYFDAQLVDGL